MRLVRIEAGRFGKIDGRTLGDLSPGLTVVHGPNEAGKSSLTALVRHVLYGFPTPADKNDLPYLSGAGGREARLLFADDEGEWVVERKEGVHGGALTVHALRGRPRDALVREITSGVDAPAYRMVFAFGLAEMQQIAELKGKEGDLFEGLYSAGAGLAVSAVKVRSQLDASMAELWAKRATIATLNRAKARRDELRSKIRELESEADVLRSEASRLEGLEREVEEARTRRADAQANAERASRAVSEAERLFEAAASLAGEADRLDRESASARQSAVVVSVDEAALAAGDVVDALGAELSGFRATFGSLAEAGTRLAAVGSKIRVALDEAGWTEELALAATADAGVWAEIEAHREALTKARGRAEAAAEACDRSRAESATPAASSAGAGRPWLVPGAIVAVLGVIGAVAGAVVSQMWLSGFAGLLVLVGAALMFAGRRHAPAPGDAGPARQRLAAAEAECAAAGTALATLTASWAQWVTSHGLGDGSEAPAAIAARYQAARVVREAAFERAAVQESCGREGSLAEAYAERVASIAAPLIGEAPGPASLERVPELVSRAVAKVAEAKGAAKARAGSLSSAEGLSRDAAAARERSATDQIAAIAALAAVWPECERLEDARTLDSRARSAATDASEQSDRLSQEAAELRTRLGTERREDTLAELRLEEETVGERIADGVRDYAVLAVASKLLSLAQERYERDRQPEVVRHAEAAFARMTNGRYARIVLPLGADSIEVVDQHSVTTSPGRLSRGTAEQLYLALRLGLIDQLGEVGEGLPVLMDDILVDFSPDRLEPAARAIADLASRRQVVFLTCHPATADLLCRVAPDAVRLELERPL